MKNFAQVLTKLSSVYRNHVGNALATLAVASLMASSCAFSEPSDADNSQQQKYNRIIEKTYGTLVGTYDGYLRVAVKDSGAADPAVRLIIFMATESMTNPDGTPGTRKVPLAFLRLQSNWIEYHNLRVQGYDEGDGSFSLQVINGSNQPNRGVRPDDLDSASLRRDGEKYVGPLRTASGVIGNLEISLTNRDTTIPRETEDEAAESRRIYLEQVAGLYTGVLQSQEGEKPISIELSLAQESISGVTNYYLTGFYKRLDVPSGVVDLYLDVTLFLREVPSRFVMNGQGGGAYRISIEATLQQGVLSGRLTSLKGPRGAIRLEKAR